MSGYDYYRRQSTTEQPVLPISREEAERDAQDLWGNAAQIEQMEQSSCADEGTSVLDAAMRTAPLAPARVSDLPPPGPREVQSRADLARYLDERQARERLERQLSVTSSETRAQIGQARLAAAEAQHPSAPRPRRLRSETRSPRAGCLTEEQDQHWATEISDERRDASDTAGDRAAEGHAVTTLAGADREGMVQGAWDLAQGVRGAGRARSEGRLLGAGIYDLDHQWELDWLNNRVENCDDDELYEDEEGYLTELQLDEFYRDAQRRQRTGR